MTTYRLIKPAPGVKAKILRKLPRKRRGNNGNGFKTDNHPMAVVDWNTVREIRARRDTGEKRKAVFESYTIAEPTFHKIWYNVTWKE